MRDIADIKLTAVAPYPATNASVRSRLLKWIERLEPGSAHVVLGGADPFGLAARRLRIPTDGPLLLLRNAAKLSRGSIEARILSAGRPGVYDVDDGLPWDNGGLHGLGAWYKRPWPRSLIALRAASAADRVIAGNEVLADWATQWCADVVIIPTCVESSQYVAKTSYELSATPRIGWMGSPATESYLNDIAPALAEVHRRTGARLTLVSGHGKTPRSIAQFTDRISWSPAVQSCEPGSWDIGIMPLRDGVYERAKCSFKLLQYAAVGLPMVGSPVGMNAEVLKLFDGLAATTTAEWTESIVAILNEPVSRRAGRGQRAKTQVERLYSYDRWEPSWRTAVGLQ